MGLESARLVAEAAAAAAAALASGLAPARVGAWARAMPAAIAAPAGWLAGREAAPRRFWRGDRAVPATDAALVGCDLAFALVELELTAGRAAANRLLNRHVALTGDVGLLAGLPALLSLRAMERGGEAGLALAEAVLSPPPPVVVAAVGGLPGVGKSTLARALAPGLGAAPGALVLRSDEIRKRRHGVPPEQRLPQSAYAGPVSRGVMAELCGAVAEAVAAGHAVVADAMFLDPADRKAVAEAARPAHFVGAWLRAPLAVLEARVVARRADASDADLAVLRRIAEASGGADVATAGWLAVDASDAAVALAQLSRAIAALP